MKTIKTIIAGSLAVLCLASCADDKFLDETLRAGGNMEEAVLTVSTEDVLLTELKYKEEAVAFSWTPGTNYGTGGRISYKLEIDRAGNEFTNPYVAVDGTQVYSYAPGVEDFNKILRSHFEAEGSERIDLEARLTATVAGVEQVQTSTVTFSATVYEPVTETLFLIGDAAPCGWNKDNAVELKRTDKGVFTWTGAMKKGSFKFLVSKDDWVPSYNKGTDGALVYRATYDDPDEQWQIEEDYAYRIDVNLLTGSLSYVKAEQELPRFDMLYLIGNMTGWSFVPFDKVDLLDPFLIRLSYNFEVGGEFKFGTAEGSWENNYKAPYGNAPYTEQQVVFVEGYDPDNKWNLLDSELGYYKICVDVRRDNERMIMTPFTPYEGMYLVGDSTPNGWSIGDATPMTRDASDPCIFTWTGTLNAGELKFTCDKQGDWNGAWFLASLGDKAPTGAEEQMLFVDKSSDAFKAQYKDLSVGDVDQKWRISEAGTYSITLNQFKETVTISKQ